MKKAMTPDEVTPLFLEFFEAEDMEGIMSLFEDDAVWMAGFGAPEARGKEQIRQIFTAMLQHKPSFGDVEHRPAIVSGDIALTSTKIPGGQITVEIVRKQTDGSWRWVVDMPGFVASE